MSHPTAPAAATRLNAANLPRLSPAVRTPAYDRGAAVPGIVHIGVGNFHRAHQAAYLDDLLHEEGGGWGVCGIGLLPQDARMRDVLLGQDGLYTLVTRNAEGQDARVIGSIVDYLHAPSAPEAALRKLAAPESRIVSLTVTDRGYPLVHGSGRLDEHRPEVRHDLAHPTRPVGVLGYLAEGLGRRRAAGLPPFTVMCCDNLQNNGDLVRDLLLAFLDLGDPTLARWVADHGAFPNGMVDRITPATTEEHRALVREAFGVDDAWPVTAERFRQWVLEDRFVQGRPAWERVGVQMTADVAAYEKMKIRLLNGGHQVMCHVGMALGFRRAPEAMADRAVRRLLERFMAEEAAPLLPPLPGVDLRDYQRTLLERFADPAIDDQLGRIAADASARIPEFLLPTIRGQLALGGPIGAASLAVAAWIRNLVAPDEKGVPVPLDDPMAGRVREAALRRWPDPGEVLSISELFGNELAVSRPFREHVGRALRAFQGAGARAALESWGT